jgi:prolyl-tRNA synthetase
VTGAEVGFAGPMGLDKKVYRLLIDHAVAAMAIGAAGANKTDHHVLNVVPGRDFALDGANVVIADIRNAAAGDKHTGRELTFSRGIEVGHVFKLGTKYSEKLDARFLDETGVSKPCIMGCYGIGVNRIFASAIEIGNDDNGCILPITIAPFEVEVVAINRDNPQVMGEAERIYNELQAAGVDTLLDDRDARPGVKFKDADLLGIPVRVVVGEKNIKDGKVELKHRTQAKPDLVATTDVVGLVRQMVTELTAKLQA